MTVSQQAELEGRLTHALRAALANGDDPARSIGHALLTPPSADAPDGGEIKAKSKADSLAPMTSIPEALACCRPASIGMDPADASELDIALPPPLSDERQRAIRSWDFDLHAVPTGELSAVVFGALLMHDELTQLGFCRTRLWMFVKEVENRYRANP